MRLVSASRHISGSELRYRRPHRSEDLAVAVKATEGSLGTINNELGELDSRRPKEHFGAEIGRGSSASPKSVRAVKGDILLAIIHGVGPQGWHSPDAKQTFLFKNAVGANLLGQSGRAWAKKGKAETYAPQRRRNR